MKLLLNGDTIDNSSVLTLGSFDGFHIGHDNVVKQCVYTARSLGLPSVVVTFDKNPQSILNPQNYQGELISLKHKIMFLANHGVDYCLLLEPSSDFFQQKAKEFYINTIIPGFSPSVIIESSSHVFGQKREGSIETLKELGAQYNFSVKEEPLVQDNKGPISSSRIRECIHKGDIYTAWRFLGHPLYISGTIVHGKQLGRTLGFPTANIAPDFPIFQYPKGVYIVKVFIRGANYYGLLSIGTNPSTDQDSDLKYEVHILHFQEELYGHPIAVQMRHFLRPEHTFSSQNELISQMHNDVARARYIIDTHYTKRNHHD